MGKNIENIIINYLNDNIISVDDRVALEEWLEADSNNKKEFKGIKEVHRLMSSKDMFEDRYVEDNWREFNKKLSNSHDFKLTKEPRKMSKFRPFIYSIAAAAVMLFFFSVYLKINNNNLTRIVSSRYNEILSEQFNEVSVEKGGRASVIKLPDGSTVTLNSGSTIKYPMNLGLAKTRNVYISGEAYFNVKKKDSSKFMVIMGDKVIQVLGTSFTVQYYPDSPYTRVNLMTGSILIEWEEMGVNKKATMEPRDEFLFSDLSASATIHKNMEVENSWMAGIIRFKDNTLIEIVERLERAYDVDIFIQDEKVANTKYSGSFSLDQGIIEILNIVNYEDLLIIKKEKKQINITIKN